MIGWTVEKNSASGMRVRASRFRLVMVSVSEMDQRSLPPIPVAGGAPDNVGAAMAVVMRALRLRLAVLPRRRGSVGLAGPAGMILRPPVREPLRLCCGRSARGRHRRGWARGGGR